MGFSATIYHIWAQRNAILHQGYVKTEEQLVGLIRKQVKMRIGSLSSYPSTIENAELSSRWGFSVLPVQSRIIMVFFVWSHNVWVFMEVCFLALAPLF